MPSPSRAEEVASIKGLIEACLHEDPANLGLTLASVDRLAWTFGGGLYSNLLLLLFNLSLPEEDARRLWDGVLKRRAEMEQQLGRPVGLRAGAVDYLVERNRRGAAPGPVEVLEFARPAATAMIDPITRLHTRAFLQDQLPREAGRARRFKTDLSFVHLEVDDFDRVSEELGTTVGSVVLKEIAEIIRGCIRDIDYAARTSGPEFALLLTETDRMGAYYVAERIRQKVETFSLQEGVSGCPLALSTSAGVASFPEDAGSARELAERAREAYFTARARGVSRVAIYYRERREYIRLAVDNQDLQVTLIPEGAASSAASLKNISSGGVLFESPRPIELGRTVQILCRNRREADQVVIPGQVVRIEKFESPAGPRYEVGVLFDIVVEEQLEGVIEFLERFSAEPEDPGEPAAPSEQP